MRNAASFAALLVVVAASSARAQELPPWAGHFMSEGPGELELALVPNGDAVEGALTRGASVFEVTARAQDGRVEGTCRVFSDDHPSRRERVAFSAATGDDGAVALTVGGVETRLVRVPGSPTAAEALAAVSERLLTPGSVEENQAAAVRMLSLLVTSQSTFHGEADFATFEELERLGDVDGHLARGVRKGYRFAIHLAPDKTRWLGLASPLTPDTGRLHFAVNKDGIVHESKTAFKPNEGCELQNDSPTRPAGSSVGTVGGPSLAHVRPGQRYVYTMTNAGAPKMDMIYTVREVGDQLVKYEVSILMDMGQGMAPVGEPTPQEWRYEQAQQLAATPDAPGQGKTETRRERVTISGLTLDCLVVTTGKVICWIPMSGDVATFPGVVKTAQEGQMNLELVRIEGPR